MMAWIQPGGLPDETASARLRASEYKRCRRPGVTAADKAEKISYNALDMNTETPSEPNLNSRPVLWEYRDARAFVAAACRWKATVDPDFSFRALARQAGFASPNYPQMFIRGLRNLRKESAESLAEALGLDPHEKAFFVLLTVFTQTDDPEKRRALFAELLHDAIRNGGTGTLDQARLAYFSHWYIPVVHAMASLADFRADPAAIAKRISPPVRRHEAEKALRTLCELGILELGSGGEVRVHEPRLETDPHLRGIWIREYHRAMIRLSLEALDHWPSDQRTVNALTVTVPHERKAWLLQHLDEIRRDLFTRLMAEQLTLDRVDGEVFQINFQVFPLTATPKHEAGS